jgi:hypothetical protein
LQKVQLKVLEDFKLTLTVTTEELLSKTLCEFYFKLNTWGGKPPLFYSKPKQILPQSNILLYPISLAFSNSVH